jgi:hypothetical protein
MQELKQASLCLLEISKMSSHNVRDQIAGVDPSINSYDANGATLEECNSVYGAHFVVTATTSGQTRKIVAPSVVGLKFSISAILTSGTMTIAAPAGTTFDGTNATLTFTQATGQLWITLESFNIAGVLQWRPIARGAGVTLTA